MTDEALDADLDGEPSVNDGLGDTAGQFISFTIDKEEYAVDILCVREIKAWMQTTAIPNAPRFIRGVINLRGLIIPIFDLRARFGQPLTETTETHVVIIIAVGERTVGLLVDSVSDILTLTSNQIKPVPDMEAEGAERFLTGLAAMENKMVALLDLETVTDLSLTDTSFDSLVNDKDSETAAASSSGQAAA